MKAMVMANLSSDNKLIINYLNELNIEVQTPKDHSDAFNYWMNYQPDLIVIEENNHMNGIEFVQQIRKHEFNQHTYILMIQEDNETCLDLSNDCGADDFIASPISSLEFKRRINTAIRTISFFEQNLVAFILTRMMEAREPGIQGHLERVGTYSKILLDGLVEKQRYKEIITHEFTNHLFSACQLHDIGKVGIDDLVLKKPGYYTKEEFNKMKEHVMIGYEIIRSIFEKFPKAKFLKMALDVTKYHHEKFDGTGYPVGLKGENIPLAARIVGLADFYDALTTHRVYKRKYSHEEAKKLILDQSGTHFDPELVDIFIENEQKFETICKMH